MCDQTNPYKPGDRVWAHLNCRAWWPGTVVLPSDTPPEFQDFINMKKPIVIVQFATDKKFETVHNLNKITLYNCTRKLEFLRKGHMLYKRQIRNGLKSIYNCDFNFFLQDVIQFEKETNGDLNIFEQFEPKKIEGPVVDINALFTTEKSRKMQMKKKVVKGRQSLPALKISTSLPTNKKSTPKTKLKPVASALPPSRGSARGSVSSKFVCYFDVGTKCSFITHRYEHLKRHMAEHKAEAERIKQHATSSSSSNTNTEISSTSSVKRNNARGKKSQIKKIKLHDELLKEWDFDETEDVDDITIENNDTKDLDTNTIEDKSKDEDKKSLDTNTIDSEEIDVNKSLVENEKNDIDTNINQDKNVVEDISQDTNVVKDQKEVKTTMIKPEISTIFDFEDDDSSNLIPDLRPSKSDNNSTTEDEVNESFDAKCDQEFITSTIVESTKSQLPVEESDQGKGQSKDFENDIESSKLLLKKTVSTLDQISNLEESMNSISSSGNKLIGDDQSNESLNEITYLDTDFNNHLDVVASTSIQTENEAMVKTNVNSGDYLVTIPAEMQQLNDNEESSSNYIVIDDENKKLCSNVDSTQVQNIDTEEVVDRTENGRYEFLLDGLPTPDWIKQDSWESFQNNGLKEVVKLPTGNENNLPEFLKETPRAVEQGICSGGGLIGAMPSSKINTETERSEDHLQPDSSSFWIY